MFQNIIAVDLRSKKVRCLATDIFIVGIIYLLPTLSHLTSVPFYLFEPMRFALVFAIIFTNRINSMLIAVTLPLISILISSHPDVSKGLIISTELLLNIVLFYYLKIGLNTIFVAMFISTFISKLFYYLIKLFFIQTGFITGDLISTPLWIQSLILIAVSVFSALLFRNKKLVKI